MNNKKVRDDNKLDTDENYWIFFHTTRNPQLSALVWTIATPDKYEETIEKIKREHFFVMSLKGRCVEDFHYVNSTRESND